MKKIIILVFTIFSILLLNVNQAYALPLDTGSEYSIYNTRLDYESQSSLSNTSIYKLSFQTQNAVTFDYEYIADMWDVFTYSHLFLTEYYIYTVPNFNVVSLQVVNYSNNNVIYTLTGISYIIFDFDSQIVTFRADIIPLIPLQLDSVELASADMSIRLLIENDENVYNAGYNAGENDGYNDGYGIGYDVGYNAGENDGYNDGMFDYGYYDGTDYISADEWADKRYNDGLGQNRNFYGYLYNGNWLTAEQWGDIRYDVGYDNGLSGEIDWFSWATTFFLMPFRILNIQILPGIRIGYFALFSLLLGVVGWFFFIVGKGGGRRK